MKFSDIDFDAIGRMMNSLSDEQKENLETMARDMMGRFQNQPAGQETEDADVMGTQEMEEEEEVDAGDFKEQLNLSKEVLALDEKVLKALEQSWETAFYYDDFAEADVSGAVLYLSKAFLLMLRANVWPVIHAVLPESALGKSSPQFSTLSGWLYFLMQPEYIETLVNEGFGSEAFWTQLKDAVSAFAAALARAEYDSVLRADYDILAELFLHSGLVSQIQSL